MKQVRSGQDIFEKIHRFRRFRSGNKNNLFCKHLRKVNFGLTKHMVPPSIYIVLGVINKLYECDKASITNSDSISELFKVNMYRR